VKLLVVLPLEMLLILSVSSNGSTWVKLFSLLARPAAVRPFSILERIDVGETRVALALLLAGATFSILERIDVGETHGTW